MTRSWSENASWKGGASRMSGCAECTTEASVQELGENAYWEILDILLRMYANIAVRTVPVR
ncbi:hypothetical protein BVI434_3890003 [Burkholderia vietnamiensis]|nr:hypothetical protein BVI434_3890003 [Burkholderia vietnamiensis]